jgi:hypothetical protein
LTTPSEKASATNLKKILKKTKKLGKKTLFRLSILIDKPTLFINSWSIRLSVDYVLLINTRSLSIVIDKPIPVSIGISNLLGGQFHFRRGIGDKPIPLSIGISNGL